MKRRRPDFAHEFARLVRHEAAFRDWYADAWETWHVLREPHPEPFARGLWFGLHWMDWSNSADPAWQRRRRNRQRRKRADL